MQTAAMQYSTLFHCLYDHPERSGLGHMGFSVFRAIDCRDIDLNPTPLPYVHDFAVIWDEDHDTRIIPVIEEMLMAGILPGVQFIGEHKGTITIVLAAKTYWKINTDDFADRVRQLTAGAIGDFWDVDVGMYDHSEGNLRKGEQCQFYELTGHHWEQGHAFLYLLDATWRLGTKCWNAADAPVEPYEPSAWLDPTPRYEMPRRRSHQATSMIAFSAGGWVAPNSPISSSGD